ncbi:MAG: hypothetical protein LBC17_03470 [Lactobacillaceae bacterium]|jgi:predicted DNA-binding protein YlxM (UPF0122 family)|nr:hypothetical protein [Lactobacillaceae bacterium]
MELEDKQEIISLLSFYEPLLSKKANQYLESYFIDDLSMIEIAENAGVTKQAISDRIKRAIKELNKFENKLGLKRKFVARIKIEKEILKTGNLKLLEKLIEVEEQ